MARWGRLRTRLRAALAVLQWAALGGLLVANANTYRLVAWETENRPNLYVEFRGVVLFLPDYLLMALAGLTLLRIAGDAAFRAHLMRTVRVIFADYGGLWWVGLALWMLVGVVWANERRLVLYSALHVMACLGMAFLVADFVRAGHEFGWLVVYSLAAAFQGALAAAQSIHRGPLGLDSLGEVLNRHTWPDRVNDDPSQAFYRGNGLAVNPNNLAGYLLVGVFAWADALRYRNKWWRVPLWLAGAMIGAGLLATYSRTAWLALAVAGSVALLAWLRQRMTIWRGVLVVIGLAEVSFALAVMLLFLAGAEVRLTGQDYHTYYRDTRDVIQMSPLVGVGAGNLMTEVSRLRGGEWAETLLPAHNVFLIIRAELGIPGLILFVLGCIVILSRLFDPDAAGSRLWLYAFFAVVIVMCLDYYLWGDHRSRILFFWVLGMNWGRLIQAHDARPDDQNGQGD